MKTVFLEAADRADNIWLQMLGDAGLDKAEVVTGLTGTSPKKTVNIIKQADEIHFYSSFTPGTDSLFLIKNLLRIINDLPIKGKRIVSAGYLLDALNDFFKFIEAPDYYKAFEYNEIYELNDGCVQRIKFNPKTKKYYFSNEFHPNCYLSRKSQEL